MSEHMRAEFEKFAKSKGWNIDHNGQHYNHSYVYYAWQGWQASRRSLVVKLPVLFVDGVDAAEYRDCVLESLNDAGASYEEMPINNEVSNGGK